MLVVKTIPTSSHINKLIYKLAASIQKDYHGYLKYIKQGGETFIARWFLALLEGAAQGKVSGPEHNTPPHLGNNAVLKALQTQIKTLRASTDSFKDKNNPSG